MNYHLNMTNTSSLSTGKRSFHGRQLQYQERAVEQAISSPSVPLLSSSYLTADSAWKTVATIVTSKVRDEHKAQVERTSERKRKIV
jgi:hypothetical protein